MADNQIQFLFRVSVHAEPDEVGYVSHCPELDVFSQGKTEESAIRNLHEALELFIETCYENGTLLDVLRESGYEISKKCIQNENEHIMEIPFSLVSHGQANAN